MQADASFHEKTSLIGNYLLKSSASNYILVFAENGQILKASKKKKNPSSSGK